MATNGYDAIVVGARCAGSPTAMLLARNGHKVLLLDKDHFPSDTLSTHMVHPPGIACLKQWGLLDRLVATGCPAIERYKFDFGYLHDPRTSGADRRRWRGLRPSPDNPRQAPRGRRPGSRSRSPRRLHGRGDCCSRTVASPASAAMRKAAPPPRSTPASSSARMGGTRSWPSRFSPSSTTRSRRSSPATTRTGATCRWRDSRFTSASIEAGGHPHARRSDAGGHRMATRGVREQQERH